MSFIPAKNASVLGAGIDGKYKPLNDSDMEISDSDTEVATVPSRLSGKGKAKAVEEDVEVHGRRPCVIKFQTILDRSSYIILQWSFWFIDTGNILRHGCEPDFTARSPTPNSATLASSVLQSLLYTRPLLHVLRNHSNCTIPGYCIVCELKKVVEDNFFSGLRRPFNPKNITQKLPLIAKGMRIGRQEDAHEFLRYLVDACQKVCLQKYPEKERPQHAETTFVFNVFGGKTRSRVTCKRCGHNSDTFETCLDLSLDLSLGVTTVEEALAAYVKPERLGGKGDDRYKCEKCKIPVDAEKQFTIEAAPQVLTVHLKRFTGTGRKIGRPIGYPTSLDLSPYVSEGVEPMMYSLYGIIAHSGSGPHSGHYFAHIKSPNDRWHEMNDEDVSPGTVSPPLNMREAYILFYIQSPSPSPPARPRSANPIRRPYSVHDEAEAPEGDKLFGSAEIAAASAREQEKMSATQKTLSLRINQAETLKKAGVAGPVTSTVTAMAVSAHSRPAREEDEEDLGEKVESPHRTVPAPAPKFIGPQLPPERNPPLRASGTSSASVLADSVDKMNLLSPINSRSFYGASDSNRKKRASSPAMADGDDEAVARKKKRSMNSRNLMSGVAADTLGLKSKDDLPSKLGYPGGPPEKFKIWHAGGSVKKGMQKRPKHRSLM
ncbi:hypothetical protein FRB90_011891 [Tulasnella sp. 427]|nr:hypothetical protein FRB90_011891 [Tulasnella sp. 427]